MDDDAATCRLLSLPAELRIRIYELYFSDGDQKNKYLYGPLPSPHKTQKMVLLRVCRQLYQEATPVFWSVTIFSLSHAEIKGPWDRSALDERYYLWLRDNVKDAAKHIRRLEVTTVRKCPASHMHDPDRSSRPSAYHIDLNQADVDQAVASDCGPKVLMRPVKRACKNVPRVNGAPLVTQEILWDIYDFSLRYICGTRRTWMEFSRAYELNQSKARPRRWSESVWNETRHEVFEHHNIVGEDQLKYPGPGYDLMASTS